MVGDGVGVQAWQHLARDGDAATRIVRAAIGHEPEDASTWIVECDPVPFTNMTTAALARVRGSAADAPTGSRWSLFVKVVQPPSASPIWDLIPTGFRAGVLDELPWRAEVELARSGVGAHLPDGLRMPVVHGIEDLDGDRAALWMEDVADVAAPWDLGRYGRAAGVLGRLAGSLPEARIPAGLPLRRRDLRAYFAGRVSVGVLPGLFDDATWRQPCVRAAADSDLRADLEALVRDVPALLDRLDALPRTVAHGDACPQNLLEPAGAHGDVTAIDWAFAGVYAVGYDLAQLLAGRAESGDLDPSDLREIADVLVPAYVAGAAGADAHLDAGDAELGFLGSLVVRSAFTAVPLERLADPDTPELRRFVARRVGYARFLVDLARSLQAA